MLTNTVQNIERTKEICDDYFLLRIAKLNVLLANNFSNEIIIDDALTRKLVSFQANKTRAHYRWYKYKEAFSADLVEYLFQKYNVNKGKILDPFAGAGTALFVCSSLGYNSEGIEVLPVGQKIIEANILSRVENKNEIVSGLERWLQQKSWDCDGESNIFEILRITDGAYPKETHHRIARYLNELEYEKHGLKEILFFALLCILESISYTRKDGQCLRWDYRSGRRSSKNKFDKGRILSFDEAISTKLDEIKNDISFGANKKDLFSFALQGNQSGSVNVIKGSCLDILPTIKSETYSGIITSPPYCNRYDYTRTYALEHAVLGVTESELSQLRQTMLSCTVENKEKELFSLNGKWEIAINICNDQPLLQEILRYLDYKKEKKELNNTGIVRMVRGYFYEMACVIQECYRVLEKDGFMFMVNDNVRYAGVSIPVDMILSKIAGELGFCIESILSLPQKKGNSSQQMGKHGRQALRKCVYVWKKVA